MSAVHWCSGIGQISAASSSRSASGGSSRPPGQNAASRRASRAIHPVIAHTSGATWCSSPPSMYTVPRAASSRPTSSGRPPSRSGRAAAWAGLWVSHASAGAIVAVIDERVRSLVSMNWVTECTYCGSGDCVAQQAGDLRLVASGGRRARTGRRPWSGPRPARRRAAARRGCGGPGRPRTPGPRPRRGSRARSRRACRWRARRPSPGRRSR